MGKNKATEPNQTQPSASTANLDKKSFKKLWRALQIELVKYQRHLIANNEKVLVILEGRDAGGKDGMIKRFTEHLSPREYRVLALGKPTDREKTGWYFQRYVPHLPYAQEIVFFNRSWYNRAGVEIVMGFCTRTEYESFIQQVGLFELTLITNDIKFFKYYLDISRKEQKKRLADRWKDPLKQWKLSPIDKAAMGKWDEYTKARDDMFLRTHSKINPWHIVKADNKKWARVNTIKHFLSKLDYADKDASLANPDPSYVFEFQEDLIENGVLAK